MSASTIGKLRVMLGLDTDGFKKGAKGVGPQLAQMRNQFLAVAGVASALGASLSAVALKGARAIDDTAKAARRLDASLAGYRALEMAADDAGVSLSSLANDVQTMNREIAKNSKGAQDALRTLGLAASDLEGLDVDEKMASIADRIKALGLDSAQASVLLQQLGVRNREMALLMVQGGDALRAARKDVEDFGLALSDVDAAAIERANDQIAGLGDITTYVSDQLDLRLVPSMGALAERMTESLRAGGALRTMLDGMIDNLGRMTAYVGTVAAGFGVRYVGALVAARLATMTLAGSMAFLRGAIMRTGIGLLVVGAGELVYQFTRLVSGAGGFGNAMGLLGGVAREVWDRIKLGAEGLGRSIRAVAEGIQSAFVSAFAWIVRKFSDVTQTIADGINNLFEGIGLNPGLRGMGAAAADALDLVAKESSRASTMQAQAAGALYASARKPLTSLAALKSAMTDVADETGGAAGAAAQLNDALDQIAGGGGGGGGAKGATKALEDNAKAAREAEQAHQRWAQNAAGHFDGLITSGKGLSGVLSSIAKQLESKVWQQLFGGMGGGSGGGLLSSIMGIFGGGGGVKVPTSVLSAIVPKFARGTSFAPGGLSLVGEEGPELLTLPRGSQVHTASETRRMLGDGGTPQDTVIKIELDNTMLNARIIQGAGRVVMSETPKMIGGAMKAAYEKGTL